MKKINFSMQYIVAVILAVAIGVGIMAIKFISEQIVAVDAQNKQVKSLMTKHRYAELPMMTESLLLAGEKHSIEKFTSNVATFNILKTADFIQQRYKGNIVSELGIEQDYINLDMELRYSPNNTEDFYVLMRYLSTKRNPVIALDHIEFKGSGEDISQDNATPHEVFTRFSLKHPIYHGEDLSDFADPTYNPMVDEKMFDEEGGFVHDDELTSASDFDEVDDSESYNEFDDRVEG